MKVEQIKNGTQERPYADHIWQWELTPELEEEKNNILEYCQKQLMSAPKTKEEYLTAYRDRSLAFNKRMELICGGYYSLYNEKDGVFTYIVVHEYID